MSNKITYIIAACLLIFVFSIAVLSIEDDSLTMDELAHLPAGYSYLTQRDMRLNPEHPPLMKDLAGLPLLFIKGIKFPYEIKDWKEDVNGQWGFGSYFLFKSGNPADQMIFWGRIPMILILVILGFYVFKATKELFGNKTGLFALFLYSFSPTLLAHGRYVTTDVAAAAGAFIATYYFLKFFNPVRGYQNNEKAKSPQSSNGIKNSSAKNLIIAGIALGIAQLLKFSLILLFPFFGLLIFFWAILNSRNFRNFLIKFGRYIISYALIVLICFILIWLLYLYHTWDYPPERQRSDAEFNLSSFGSRILADSVVWISDKPILRPLAQYLTGVLMILQRAAGGHTTYFMGEISASGWKIYFPFVYLIKEPLAFHIMLLFSLFCLVWSIKKAFWKNSFKNILNWIKSNFVQFSALIFIAIYWTTSLSSNLNIGVRHLLPIFPFTIMLVSRATISCLKSPYLKIKRIFLIWLMLWQAITVFSVYPHFLSYFNEIVGRPENGYNYTVDSNLDWGQDLKRLTKWVNENNIDKIYLDYFGGTHAPYYLKDKFMPWWGTRNPNELPKGSYLAVSVSFLQGGRGKPVPGFNQDYGYYLWLDQYTPVKKIGNSIFIYHID